MTDKLMTDKLLIHDDDIIKTEEGLVFNPYNPLNVKITLSEVQSILSKYNIPPISNIVIIDLINIFIYINYNNIFL
jgi:hypothetical protein